MEDALNRTLRADLCISAALVRARKKNAGGERVKKAADVGVGKVSREEGGGRETTEESPGQAKRLVLVFVVSMFEFIKWVTYLSTNYEYIDFTF